MSGMTYSQEDWEAPWESAAQPNQRLQLALLPFGVRPLAVLHCVVLNDGVHVLASFAPLTPELQRSAAETHNR